ncbi:MAG TPA: TonB-dependent receptor [Gemmatimonadaceae bacterium]
MKRILVTTLGLLFAASATTQAQNPGAPGAAAGPPPAAGEVSGTIVAADNSGAVTRPAVAVRNKKDSTLVAGTMGTADGTFRVQGLRPGAYYLRVSGIGFTPTNTAEFTITPAAPVATVGTVKLARFAVSLQSVQVTGQAPTMVIEPDRNTYKAKDVAPAAANASDVLQATPSVEVDGDGKVSLRGNENVVVQINGRPTPITGTQLAAYLKQIPANIVERIEVVPNPSAKYDPEGMAGIINIVLKANTDLGVSGGLNVGGGTSNRYNGSGNLGYQTGPLTLFSTIGFNTDNRGISGINDREQLNPSPNVPAFTNQDIAGQTGNRGYNATGNVEYKVTPRDVLANSLMFNRRRGTDGSLAAYTELDANQALTAEYLMLRNNHTTGWLIDNTASWKRTFEPRKHELSTELRFSRGVDKDGTLLNREEVTSHSQSAFESDATNAPTKNLNAQLDYTRPLTAHSKLETGYKGTERWLDRDYTVLKDVAGDGNWVPSNLTNSFNFNETVHAAYGVISETVGKFDLQQGLRAEHADREFTLGGQNNPYKYNSLFPSAVVMYKPSDATQLKVSYSRRIRRPGTQELNPFPVFFDQQNVFIGNPKLNPEYTDAFELGASKSGTLGSIQLSPFYRRTTDVIRVNINTAAVIDGRNVTSVSFENLATSNSWGTDLNGSLKLGPKFSGFAGFNVFKMVTDGGSQSVLSSNAVAWSTRLNATTQFTPTVSLQGFYFYRAPMNIERGKFSAQQMLQLSMRKKVYGDKASFSVRVSDPLNQLKFRVQAGDDNIQQITERRFGVRATYFTFQYNFGQTPKIRMPKEEAPPPPVFN